ncbi:MAG TPA: alpha/beta hydrolase [Myxococcota bacterium]|nr:alpha/beta hydrolase [Myxococcota bacterium]
MRTAPIVLLLLAAAVLGLPVAAPWLGLGPDRARLPAPGRSVAIGAGLALNVVEAGSGPPVVLVHGLPSNVGDWADLPAALASRGLRAIAYDRVGYGGSSRAPADGDAYTYAANAVQLRELLDALGVERAALAGWSYGGGIVQRLAADAPERVSHLVLIGSVGPALGAEPAPHDWVARVARSPAGPAVFRWVLAIGPLGRLATAQPVAEAFSGAERVPGGFRERTAAQLALPGTVDAWILEERRAVHDALGTEAVAAPALVVHGSEDRLVPLAVGKDLAERLPRGELLVVEGGSHMLPVTHGEHLAEELHAWLARTR